MNTRVQNQLEYFNSQICAKRTAFHAKIIGIMAKNNHITQNCAEYCYPITINLNCRDDKRTVRGWMKNIIRNLLNSLKYYEYKEHDHVL